MLLQEDRYSEYTMKQCLKVCHYLQKVRQIEVLQMKVEFLKDENQNVWFSFAKDLHIRRMKQHINLIQLKQEDNSETLAQQHKHAQEELLRNELKEY